MEANLAVRNLVIEYSSGGYPVRPIDNLDLDATAGQLVLLLGASGCGKTTLLSVLAAILKPTSGSVRIGDTEVTDLRGAALTQPPAHGRHRVPGVQSRSVPQRAENVMVPMRRRYGPAHRRRRTSLERADLGHRMTHRPGGCLKASNSAIARLAHNPPVILPTSRPPSSTHPGGGVLKLAQLDDGRLVIIATHDERLIPLADGW
jgi:putative ABC transport system ATP-binding protein